MQTNLQGIHPRIDYVRKSELVEWVYPWLFVGPSFNATRPVDRSEWNSAVVYCGVEKVVPV